jgi:enoyl-CoA hydratase/carnithine racemase
MTGRLNKVADKLTSQLSNHTQNINVDDMNADEAIAFENRLFAECFSTEDQKEGMAAFLAKRLAEFKNK